MRLSVALVTAAVLSAGISSCKCDSSPPSASAEHASGAHSPLPGDIPPLDPAPRLEAEPVLLRAIDTTRAVAVIRRKVYEPVVLSLVDAGHVRWSRRLPCDPARAGILDACTAGSRIVVRCLVGPEPGVVGTVGFEAASGAVVWSVASGSAAGVLPDSIHAHAAPGVVVGVGGGEGLEAFDPKDGSRRWHRRATSAHVEVVGDLVLSDGSTETVLLDADSGAVVRKPAGRVAGVLDNGLCVLSERGLEWEGRKELRTLLAPPSIAKLVDAGMRPDHPGLRVACGRRTKHIRRARRCRYA